MNRSKLNPGRIWPNLQIVPKDDESPEPNVREAGQPDSKTRHCRLVPSKHVSHKTRPNGSYSLRRGAVEMVRSVYLTRVLDFLERLFGEEGDGLSQELALVWVASDGSREIALKGRALKELGASRR